MKTSPFWSTLQPFRAIIPKGQPRSGGHPGQGAAPQGHVLTMGLPFSMPVWWVLNRAGRGQSTPMSPPSLAPSCRPAQPWSTKGLRDISSC